MKKSLLFSALAMMMASANVEAITLPIQSDEPIYDAPAGTVVDNAIRKGFSYYYSGGSVLGGYNDSFVGNYVITDDAIYLKEACASTSLGTYLKLDKIDDENYVARTAQMIYADVSGDTPYVAYATRLVYHKYGDYSYGYVVEEDENGAPVTDVYFTYKNGVLKQVCQDTIDMNGQILPVELIGFTNATGGWMGYGDACIEVATVSNIPTTLPEGAELKQTSFAWSVLASHGGFNSQEAQLVQSAEVGNDYYLSLPGIDGCWLKGEIDRTAGTVTFSEQYIGQNEELGVHQWFVPAKYNDWFDVWDEEDGDGYWMRDYTKADKLVMKYENGVVTSDPEDVQVIFISRSNEELASSSVFSNPIMMPYEESLETPANPMINWVDPNNGWWGEFHFAMPNTDVNGKYISKDNLYYRIYVNSEEVFTFKTSDFGQLPSNTTDMSANYADSWDFEHNGSFYTIYFYDDWNYVGVQSVYKLNGEEKTSKIAWYNHTPSEPEVDPDEPTVGINTTEALRAAEGKFLQQGSVVIIKDGKNYNAVGQHIK